MLKLEKKHYWVVGLIAAILSFVLLFIGIKVISASIVSIENIMAYIVFSLLVGIVASALIFFRLKIVFYSFAAGLVGGFLFMYKAFLYDMTGWGDLIGVLSLLICIAIGLGFGLVVQLVYYLYKKYKKK